MIRTLALAAAVSSLSALAAPPPSTPELVAKGKAAFEINCVACHGTSGKGDGPAAAALNPKPRDYTKEAFKNGSKPEEVFKTITEGIPPPSAMVAWKHLPEADRWALTYYVLTFVPAAPAAPAKPEAKKPDAKKPAPKK